MRLFRKRKRSSGRLFRTKAPDANAAAAKVKSPAVATAASTVAAAPTPEPAAPAGAHTLGPEPEAGPRRAARRRRWRWLTRKPSARQRVETRHACRIGSTLSLIDEDFDIHGDLLDLSPSGAMFRPSSKFLLYRHRDMVQLRTADGDHSAEIMNSSPRGYGIRFERALKPLEIKALLAQSREKPTEMSS